MTTETVGTKLSALRARSGLSIAKLAKDAQFAGASSIQRYLEPTYDSFLPVGKADAFARVLTGLGDPPIRREEVMDLCGLGTAMPGWNAVPVLFEGEAIDLPQENLPVWGTGLGAARLFDEDAVEQTDLNSGNIIEYVKRPAILKGKRFAYGLHVQGSSMEPMYDDGEMVVAVGDVPLSAGDGVVVYLRDAGQDDGARSRGVLIKRLVRRSASYIELRQYEPAVVFRVPMDQVLRVDRILSRREMLS